MSEGSYRIRTSTEIFDREELEILRRYGRQFERLMNGERAPMTPEQERFIEVCRGEAKPVSDYEEVWWKYLQRIEWESDPSNRGLNGPPRRVDEGFRGSREEHRAMRAAQFADLRRRD